MREEIRRAHHVHELRIDHPPALRRKGLRLDKRVRAAHERRGGKRGKPPLRHQPRTGSAWMHLVADAVLGRVPSIRQIDCNNGRRRRRQLCSKFADRVVQCRYVAVFREFLARDHLRVKNRDVRILRARRSDDARVLVRRGGDDRRFALLRRVVVVSGVQHQDIGPVVLRVRDVL